MARHMDLALRDHPVETAADAAAAVIFAAATAFAASALFASAAVPAALLAFVPLFVILRQSPGIVESYALPAFQLADLPDCEPEPEELLLTAEMMLDSPVAEPSEELVLDDVLARLGPDSARGTAVRPGKNAHRRRDQGEHRPPLSRRSTSFESSRRHTSAQRRTRPTAPLAALKSFGNCQRFNRKRHRFVALDDQIQRGRDVGDNLFGDREFGVLQPTTSRPKRVGAVSLR